MTPCHSPPVNVSRDTEPFFQPTSSGSAIQLVSDSSSLERTGPDTSVDKQLSAGKLQTDRPLQGAASSKRTGPDTYDAVKHKSSGKPQSDALRPKSSSSGCTGPDNFAAKHQSTDKPQTDPTLTDLTPTDHNLHITPAPHLLYTDRRDSISSLESGTESELSDQPPVELFVEEGELSDNQDLELEQTVSEEQTERNTLIHGLDSCS